MNIVVGRRIPIGAAIGGAITFGAEIWNTLNPEAQLSVAAVGGLSTALVAVAQLVVVNRYGVTQPPKN